MLCWNCSASNTQGKKSYILACLSSSIFGVCYGGLNWDAASFPLMSSQILINTPSRLCLCIGLCFFWLILLKGLSQTWENMGELLTLYGMYKSGNAVPLTLPQSGIIWAARHSSVTVHANVLLLTPMGDFPLPLAIKTPGEWVGKLFKNFHKERCTPVI